MAQDPRPVFPHRHNPDGTIDSICTRCFATVATEARESDLKKAEDAHVCSELDLMRLSWPTNDL
jgi:hypothetical protein